MKALRFVLGNAHALSRCLSVFSRVRCGHLCRGEQGTWRGAWCGARRGAQRGVRWGTRRGGKAGAKPPARLLDGTAAALKEREWLLGVFRVLVEVAARAVQMRRRAVRRWAQLGRRQHVGRRVNVEHLHNDVLGYSRGRQRYLCDRHGTRRGVWHGARRGGGDGGGGEGGGGGGGGEGGGGGGSGEGGGEGGAAARAAAARAVAARAAARAAWS